MIIQATKQVIRASRAKPDLVKKIYTASSADVLRQVILGNNVGKIIVHPAFEHKLLQNRNGAYKEYIESVTALFQTKEDSKNTLIIYESKADISYAREVFAKYGAILDPEHWIIDSDGYLRGKGSMNPVEIVREMAKNSSAFVIGGLLQNCCVETASLDVRKMLIDMGASDFPRTINKLIAKNSYELDYFFHDES